MKKTYFAKYLPVEGVIKDSDLVLYTGDNGESLRMRYVGVYDKNNFDDKHSQLLKLFLCSRDIKVGDTMIDIVGRKWENVQEWDIKAGKEQGGCYKVIGVISTDAIWVKEGDEFDEDEVKITNHIKVLPPYNFSCKIKCPTCKTFH